MKKRNRSGEATRDTATPARADLPPVPDGVYCPECSYDLRSLTGERCPECGFGLAIVRTQDPQIPWSRRHELGWFRGYWRTVREVVRRPRHFCLETVRPISHRDSQTFRWLTFLHAYLPTVLGSIGAYGVGPDWRLGWPLLGLVVVLGLMLAALPDLGAFVYEPRGLRLERRCRAVALSYYAWAPLAWAVIALPVLALALLLVGADQSEVTEVVALGLAAVSLAVALGGGLSLAVYTLDRFAKHALRYGLRQRIRRLALFIALSLVLLIFAVLVPFGVFFLFIVHISFQ